MATKGGKEKVRHRKRQDESGSCTQKNTGVRQKMATKETAELADDGGAGESRSTPDYC